MKSYNIFLLLGITLSLIACIKEPTVVTSSKYDCTSDIVNTHPNSAVFDAFLEDKIKQGIPGMTMIVESPAGIWTGAAGLADIPNNIPMKACNKMRIGSTTKTFTATIILQLAEQGILNLSDSISQYLAPEMVKKIANAELATIEQLLNHTSGIEDYTGLINYSIKLLNDLNHPWTPEEELAFIYEEPAAFAPGTQRKYSNSNYLLLGLIAERVTGKSGTTLFQEQIFTPLNLANTSFNQVHSTPEDLVRGYSDEEENFVLVDRTDFTFAHSSMDGGAISTVADLRTYVQAAMTPGRLFSAEMIERMKTVIPPSGEDQTISTKDTPLTFNGIGLGWFNMKTPYGTGYGHGGALRGYKANMIYFPDSKTSVCYLMNGNNGKVSELEKTIRSEEIVSLLFE